MYSEQDLKYAAQLREEIHREALAIVRKTRPNAAEVVDRHPVEDYFQESWEYPGRFYTVVAIPYGYKSRKALVDAIVRDTLAEPAPEPACTQKAQIAAKGDDRLDPHPDGRGKPLAADDPFYRLIAGYPDLVVDYRIVKDARYYGYDSHRKALKIAYAELCADWSGHPDRATGKRVAPAKLFSSEYQDGELNYRKAFLYPPHENSYTGEDFVRVNAALFPSGTDDLEVYEWTTDWSEYFDEGHEWWGALCLTVYDKALGRFVVIMASATD